MVAAQPDVIVGELTGPQNYTGTATHDAFSLGTTSCNIGTTPLAWIASTNQHPVIGGTLYRVYEGRFMQVGQSWLKHGFTALQGTVCGACAAYPNGTALGVGCSDPYGASLNGQQSGLGPKFEVNASSGYFPYPYTNPSYSGNDRRLLVPVSLLNAPGAQWISEAQYIQSQDALANNDNNNCSYRISSVTGGPTNYSLSFTGPTVRQLPAISAWADLDPGVVIQTNEHAGADGGLFTLGVTRTDNGDGTWHFEYAVHNMNCNDSGGGFSVNFANGVTISNIGFYSTPYHSGEPLDGTAWNSSTAANGVSWNTVQSYAVNPLGNALRWGTTYNFWFDSTEKNPTGAALTTFQTGTVLGFAAPTFPVPQWETNSPTALLDVDGLENDAFVSPIQGVAITGSLHQLNLNATAGLPFFAFLTTVPGLPGNWYSPNEQIINLDYADASFLQWPGLPSTMPGGGIAIPFVSPSANIFVSGQMYAADPTNADLYALSALTELTITPGPKVIVEAVGSNSYNAVTTSGFWRVIHNGTTAANITSVTVSFLGATGQAGSMSFDGDQTGMSGQFNLGTTYRNGSAASTGLNFAPSTPWAASGFVATNITSLGNVTFRTATFAFTGGLFNGNVFEFDADTDGTSGTNGGTHAGTIITVTLSDATVLNGNLVADPNDPNRAFVEFF
jgi:hypothetical protein